MKQAQSRIVFQVGKSKVKTLVSDCDLMDKGFIGGSLKLKGSNHKISKKRKEKAASVKAPLGQSSKESTGPTLTASELKFKEISRKRLEEKADKMALKSHKEKVAEFNAYLERLSEHHDVPKEFSVTEVARHAMENDCWIIIRNQVYDVSKYVDLHPGGRRILLSVAGTDATEQFEKHHNVMVVLKKYERFKIGSIKEASIIVQEEKYLLSEPAWHYSKSPYYKESHRKLQIWARNTVDEYLMPYIGEWDRAGKAPMDIYKKFASIGYLSGLTGTGWPKEAPVPPPVGIAPDEFDIFHELILSDELARIGSSGVGAVLTLGPGIALPPIIYFGTAKQKKTIIKSVLSGEKTICLAITEPYAGSDVANIQATAVKMKNGDGEEYFCVNGEKKWITNGMWADYFVVAARTGNSGMKGISLLLLEKNMPGLDVRPVVCQGNACAGTAYVTFENVKVPIKNVIGKLNQGFKAIMFNFNHERLGIIITSIRSARLCYEIAMNYSNRRRAFGMTLFEQGVIRNKLAHMARQIEASYSWLESIVFQLSIMDHQEAALKLGGPIALLKAQATVTFEFCAREASQILGGIAYTKGGVGEWIERLYRDVRSMAIPGGSEEIMLDLGIRLIQKLSKSIIAKL